MTTAACVDLTTVPHVISPRADCPGLAAQVCILCHIQVKMSRRVFKLTDVAHRVQCLAASVALYRLFATLLKLAPDMDQRAALFFPLARPHSTFITYIPGKHGAGDVVRKEIFDFARYTDEFNLDLLVLQVGNSCHDLHNHLHPGNSYIPCLEGTIGTASFLSLLTLAYKSSSAQTTGPRQGSERSRPACRGRMRWPTLASTWSMQADSPGCGRGCARTVLYRSKHTLCS